LFYDIAACRVLNGLVLPMFLAVNMHCISVIFHMQTACLGSVLWEAKSEHFMTTWSSFNVLVMPDFNQDGVPELVTAHSSDPRFPPEVEEFV